MNKQITVLQERVKAALRKLDKDEQLRGLTKDFWAFVQFSLPNYTLDSYHHYLAILLQARFRNWQAGIAQKDLVINLPPRCTKSEIVSILYPVWCQLNQRNFKVFTASHSLKLSTDLCVKSRDIIRNNNYFLLKEDNDTKTYYSTTEGGYRQSFSPKSALTGFGCDLFVYDDIENANENTAEEVNNWFTTVAYNRHNDPERALRIVVQQRVSENDFSSHLVDVDRVVLPLLYSDDASIVPIGNYTEAKQLYKDNRLSSRFSDTYITKLRTQSEVLFQTQYQQSPRPSEGTLIHKAELNLGIYPIGNHCIAFVDPATTASDTSDETGVVIASFHSNSVQVHKAYGIKLEFPDLINHLKALNIPIAVENKGSGLPLIASLQREKVSTIKLDNKNRSKTDRFAAIRTLIPTSVFINESDSKPLIKQILTWAGKNTDKDDIVDAFIYSVEHFLLRNPKLTIARY